MAGGPWSDQQNPLLSSLFGTFQAAAAQHLSTADIWSQLRQTVAGISYQTQGVNAPADLSAVEAEGARILSEQGVNAATVSTYRGIAGSWLQAKTNLQAADADTQILANAIFVPPWAKTAVPELPSRYRIRVAWQVGEAGRATATVWKSYELTGPLSSVNSALNQAASLAVREGGSLQITTDELQGASDYEVEQL